MRKKGKKLSPLLEKADRALQIAVAKVLKEHKRQGLPIYVWQDNKVVRIPPQRIRP